MDKAEVENAVIILVLSVDMLGVGGWGWNETGQGTLLVFL